MSKRLLASTFGVVVTSQPASRDRKAAPSQRSPDLPGPAVGGAGRRIKGLDHAARAGQRRQKLLDAALERFATDGYAQTAIEQLCQEAGVSTRSYYELFDGKEACYLALLRQISDRLSSGVLAILDDAPDDEHDAVVALVKSFVHDLADDPRVVNVSFGQAGSISPTVDAERRANRRWAVSFVEDIWKRYGVIPSGRRSDSSRRRSHSMAVALVGGMFDLIIDYAHDQPVDGHDLDTLIESVTVFYETVTNGVRDTTSARGG